MMIIPIPIGEPDERFLTHRLKSTSIAGICGGLLAVGLWAYSFYALDVWRWDLLALGPVRSRHHHRGGQTGGHGVVSANGLRGQHVCEESPPQLPIDDRRRLIGVSILFNLRGLMLRGRQGS
jgi:hypothetical protein